MRQLRTPWVDAWESPDAPAPLPMPLQGLLVRDAVVSAHEHHIGPAMGTPVGQVVGMMGKSSTVREVMFGLVEEFAESAQRLAGLLG